MTATTPISISTDIVQRAERNARTLGLSVSEYLSRLVVRDTPTKHGGEPAAAQDPWGPVPPEVSARWDQDVAAFEAEDRKHPRPRFTSGKAMVAYINRQS